MRLLWDSYPGIDRRLVELFSEHESVASGEVHEAIAKTLTEEYGESLGHRFSADAIRNRLKRVQFEQLGDDPPTSLMPHYNQYQELIEGTVPTPHKKVNGKGFQAYLKSISVGTHKTLVLSDFHVPLQSDEAIQQAIDRNLTASLLVVNGDVMDGHALSTFTKTQDVPIYAEIDGVVRIFSWLSKTFPDAFIVVTLGNHEQRVTRRTVAMMPAGLEFLANPNILELLARPFPNVVVLNDWFFALNDAVFAHADAASGVDAKPAVDTATWFLENYQELGIALPRLVVQAHTHRVATVYRNNLKAVESGCLCLPQSYARTTKYKRPQVQGYFVTIQRDGVSDLTNSREFPLLTSERTKGESNASIQQGQVQTAELRPVATAGRSPRKVLEGLLARRRQ